MLIKNKPIDISAVLDDAKPRGIIHCGAYLAEELPIYEAHGINDVCWIEADPSSFKAMVDVVKNRKNDITLNMAVCEVNKPLSFYIMNNDASSSLLEPTEHLVKYPDIKFTHKIIVDGRTLDSLIDEGLIDIKKYDFLYMDLQGAEHLALAGFSEHIHNIDYILTEINYEELYKDCAIVHDMDEYLYELGFEKQWATIHEPVGWGDAYYKRVSPINVVKF